MEDAAFFDYLLIAVALVVSLRWYHATILRNGSGDDPATTAGALEPRRVDYVPKIPEPTTATPLGRVLSWICLAGRYRSIDDVIEGARLAYEQVLNAFAAGDLRAETSLLSQTVREAFETAIVERQSQGHVSEFTFIGLKAADIVDAALVEGQAMIQLRFVAEVVSATRDREGRIVAGHPVQVVELAELWTFERDLASADPNWTLVGTKADEGEDNDDSHTPARSHQAHL